MIVDISHQIYFDNTLQLLPIKINTGSPLHLDIIGIPEKLGGEVITSVEVSIENPDGITATGNAEKIGEAWGVRFSPSLFVSYGTVLRGVRISGRTASGPAFTVLADLAVIAANADAKPGEPGKHYQTTGGDIYVKSEIIDGVQHYKRLSIAYNSRLGVWGFNDPSGDYVLDSNGNFIAISR